MPPNTQVSNAERPAVMRGQLVGPWQRFNGATTLIDSAEVKQDKESNHIDPDFLSSGSCRSAPSMCENAGIVVKEIRGSCPEV